MCLGLPLQVVALDAAGNALCATGEQGAQAQRRVATTLLDEPPQPGDWLLVHVDVAVRALPPAEARQIGDALRAVDAAAAGEPWEHLLADLIEREPELPPHLRHQVDAGADRG
jgi:hydrogenase expression/formation protein HypC